MRARKAEHRAQGNPCARCGMSADRHRAERKDERDEDERTTFIGVDGEGLGSDVGTHRYVFMGAATADGKRWGTTWTDRGAHRGINGGLSTLECFEFLLSLPKAHTKLFAYSFGYDLTMILRDVDDMSLYRLFRPGLRTKEIGGQSVRMPVYWPKAAPGAFSLNYFNGQFSVARITGKQVPTKKDASTWAKTKPAIVHDIWRFFQGKFVSALRDWRLRDEVFLAEMSAMKDQRNVLDTKSQQEVQAYCYSECEAMAHLARSLKTAHIEAGLHLRQWYGAGSSASAMLKGMGVEEHLKEARKENPEPPEMKRPIAQAFFGGRFENDAIGFVKGPLYSYDISSAYPYQLCFLPCLKCGKWEHTTNRKEAFGGRTCLVKYRLNAPSNHMITRHWGPFPFRLADGTIAFPRESEGGYVWRDEFIAGEKLFPNVEFLEAWVYRCACSHTPFADIPAYYRERVRIGKEGKGIVLKLGVNSCYGKTAQSIGGLGPFTSWIWAGLITSGCRAQILEAMALAKDPSSILMIATDSVTSTEPIVFPPPRDTGTYDVANEKGELKPLGGWEEKVHAKGLFLVRPGISFAPDPTVDEVKQIRGRGVGRATMVEYWRRIVDAYEDGKPGIELPKLRRFVGAKTGITKAGLEGAYRYKRKTDFGQWTEKPVGMSFDPMPKRARVLPDGRLELRAFPGLESVPYDAAKALLDPSPEALVLRLQEEEEKEQPDGGDFSPGGDYAEF